jgi:hypothetical protein
MVRADDPYETKDKVGPMTNHNDNHGETDGRTLWHRLRREQEEPAELSGWDANLLAAYLDGRTEGRDAEALEAKLAASPALLEILLAARAAGAAGEPVPPELIARAKALKPGARRDLRDRGHRNGHHNGRRSGGAPVNPVRLRMRRRIEWAVAAALLVAVCATGFELGLDTGRSADTVNRLMAEETVPRFDVAGGGGPSLSTLSVEDTDEALYWGDLWTRK